MSDIISKLRTREECANLEDNALKAGNTDLATQARKRAIELRAQAHGTVSQAERECIEAVYA